MGFRDPVTSALDPVAREAAERAASDAARALAAAGATPGEVDTGTDNAQRVRVTSTGGREGGGALELYPNRGNALPAVLEAANTTEGAAVALTSPFDAGDERTSSLTLYSTPPGLGFDGVFLDSTSGVYVRMPAGDRMAVAGDLEVTGQVRGGEVYAQARQQIGSTTPLANGLWGPIPLTAWEYDRGGFRSPSFPTRFYAPVFGVYEVSTLIHFAANDTGRRGIRLNYSPYPGATPAFPPNGVVAFTPARSVTAVVGKPLRLTMDAGGWVEMQGFQDSGASLSTFTSGDSASTMTAALVHAF